MVQAEEIKINMDHKITCPRCLFPGTGLHWRYTKYPDKQYPYVHHSKQIRMLALEQGINIPEWCYIRKDLLEDMKNHAEYQQMEMGTLAPRCCRNCSYWGEYEPEICGLENIKTEPDYSCDFHSPKEDYLTLEE